MSKVFSHDELCQIAEKWLLKSKGCGFALTELDAAVSEIPDSIGFKSGYSILVECKVSRADFLSDKKKSFRANPSQGMGVFRFYMCPEGLIKLDELPSGWGLVYVNEKGKARQVHGPKGNCWGHQLDFHFKRNAEKETLMMASALRRLHLRGRIPEIYFAE